MQNINHKHLIKSFRCHYIKILKTQRRWKAGKDGKFSSSISPNHAQEFLEQFPEDIQKEIKRDLPINLVMKSVDVSKKIAYLLERLDADQVKEIVEDLRK